MLRTPLRERYIEIAATKYDIYILNVYRPPSGDKYIYFYICPKVHVYRGNYRNCDISIVGHGVSECWRFNAMSATNAIFMMNQWPG